MPRCTGQEAATPSLDDRIDALADERRRAVLARLVRADGPLAFDDLVESLAGAGAADETPLASDTDHVALRLYHVHLPKLADAELVEYDRTREEVATTETGERLQPLFEEP